MERFSRLQIDRSSDEPAYRQLALGVLDLINRGEIAIGEQLPTVEEFCALTKLSRMTVQRAMQTLQQKRCVVSRRGRGAFVVAVEVQTHQRLSAGFVVRPHRDPHADPFYSEILHGVAEEARRANIDLAFTYGESEIERTGFPLLNKVSAMLLAGQMPDSFYQFLHRAQMLYVLIDALPSSHPRDAVTSDNEKTGRILGEYLLSLGHRRILYLNGLPEIRSYGDRFRGFRKAFSDAGACVIHKLHVHQQAQSVRDLLGEVLARGLDFSAVVGCNDMVAIWAMNELQDRGYRIPEHVSVCGFNNIPFAAHVRPSLTTVQIPKREMGVRGVQLLLHRLQNPKAVHETVLLDVSLVTRQSVARAPEHESNPQQSKIRRSQQNPESG